MLNHLIIKDCNYNKEARNTFVTSHCFSLRSTKSILVILHERRQPTSYWTSKEESRFKSALSTKWTVSFSEKHLYADER